MSVPTSRPNPGASRANRARRAEARRKKLQATDAATWLAAAEPVSAVTEPSALAPLLESLHELVLNQREILDLVAQLRFLARASKTFRGPNAASEISSNHGFLSTLIDMLAAEATP